MRIRKRPPPAVKVARAAPVLENKSESVNPKSPLAEVLITRRSERLDGGCVELSPVVSEKRHIHGQTISRRPNVKNVETKGRVENGSNNKQEDNISSGGATELLMKSLLVVFERAGTRGLSTREVVAKLVEYDLPGLQEGERSTVQVAKVLRTPDFVHREDGKYFIYPSTPHAVVAESSTQSEPSQQQQATTTTTFQARQDINNGNNSVPNLNNDGRRKRTKTVAASLFSDGSKDNNNNNSEFSDKNVEGKIELKKRRRRPPSSQHELAIGPRQCKRYDGRGWQCTRETEEGFSFCEHHQALMNKRTLRLNLAKKRRKGGTETDMDVVEQLKEGSSGNNNNNKKQQLVTVAPHGIEDLIHNNQRRRLVKARSLKSIK